MVANKYAFLQITRRRFLNEWEAFKKVISRRNIRRRITIPLTLSNLKLLRRITRTENILHRNFTRRQVAIQNRVASNIGISQSTFSVKVYFNCRGFGPLLEDKLCLIFKLAPSVCRMTFPILASLLVRLVVLLPFQLLRLSLATPSRWTPLALSVFLHCVVALLLTLL